MNTVATHEKKGDWTVVGLSADEGWCAPVIVKPGHGDSLSIKAATIVRVSGEVEGTDFERAYRVAHLAAHVIAANQELEGDEIFIGHVPSRKTLVEVFPKTTLGSAAITALDELQKIPRDAAAEPLSQ